MKFFLPNLKISEDIASVKRNRVETAKKNGPELCNLGDKKNGGFFKTDSIYLNLIKT